MSSSLETIRKLIELIPTEEGESWMIDGGCHFGEFATQLIHVFPFSNVLSFEPDPDSWEKAKKNLAPFRQIEVIQCALGTERGKAEFFRGPYSATNSLLERPDDDSKPYYPSEASLSGGTFVDVVPIEEECGKRNITGLDLLKLDLQGGELAALRGAKSFLEKSLIKVVQVESVFVRKYKDQPLLWKVWSELEKYGYTLFSLEDVKVGLYHNEAASLRHRQWNQCDAVFVSPSIRSKIDS